MLSLYKLEIFATVVQAGSFSAASERLLMTQPAVSQHIQSLEASLGTVLFSRGRRGVSLTTSGQTLYEYTLNILRLVAEAEGAVTQVENLETGQIQIGATPGINAYIVPDWIQSFRQYLPNLSITLKSAITTDIIDDITARTIELGFVEGELEGIMHESLGRIDLAPIQLHVVVGREHAWHERGSVVMDDLNQEAFVSRQVHSRTRVWLDAVFRQHGIAPKIVAEFDSPESIKQAVISGMGFAVLPEYAIQRELEAGHLCAVGIRDVALTRNLKLLWDRRMPFSPIARAFLGHLTTRDYPMVADAL